MKLKSIVPITLIGAFFVLGFFLVTGFISFSNQEIDLRNQFTQKMDQRTAFYDKMWKTIAQKSTVAIKNDSSFQNNVNVIMAGRKDAGDLFMKWVQETNPNANFDAVSTLYADLSRAIEGQRDGFFMEEKFVQGIVLEHSNHIQKFPVPSIIFSWIGLLSFTSQSHQIEQTTLSKPAKITTSTYSKLDEGGHRDLPSFCLIN